jgi:multicomponent Na+:H+ antiporter subunit G
MNDITLREIIGLFGLAFGMFFYVFGVYGFVRFQDVFMRIHSAGKVSVLGIFGFIVGIIALSPESALNAVVLGLLMFIIQPIASHSIAHAAYRSGVEMYQPVRDDLKGNIEMHHELVKEEERRQAEYQEGMWEKGNDTY